MDYSSRLKRKHLNEIIQYMKHNNIPQYDEEELDENFNENCLFIGLMPDEEPENIRIASSFYRQINMVQILTEDSPNEDEVPIYRYSIYDPGSIMSEFIIPNISSYSNSMLKEIVVS